MPLLSLRDPADSESAEPLPPFCAALVSQARGCLEPFCRTDRAMVFVWTASSPPHRRLTYGHFPTPAHHQRQSVVFELRHRHPVPCLFRRHLLAAHSSALFGGPQRRSSKK